jgi:superfamily II DNA or RNA helicase
MQNYTRLLLRDLSLSRRRFKDHYSAVLMKWIVTKFSIPERKRNPGNPVLRTVQRTAKFTKQATLQPLLAKPIVLRPYQKEALQQFLEHKKCTLEMATATGKTFIAIEAIKQLKKPTVILVPTIAILKTVWLKRLREAGLSQYLGVFYGEKKQLTSILVTTYQSAIRYPHILTRYKFIVLDEVHHVKAEEWGKLLSLVEDAEYALGLTATLGRRFDPKTMKVTKVLPVAYTYRIYEARKEGWVAPIRVFSAPVEMDGQEWTKYEQYTDIIRKVAWELGTVDPTVWSKLAKKGDKTARKGLWALSKRRTLLSSVKAKLPMTLKIIKANLDSKVLLFSESISAIENLKEYLTANGIKCATYHSKMSKAEREYALRVGWGSNFNTLLSCRALDEGLDVPEASVGILHCSGRTPRQIVQRLGRLIRARPGKTAKVYVVWAHDTIESKVLDAVKNAVWKIK